jgi:hypothetical protein
MYVLAMRPRWFKSLIENMHANSSAPASADSTYSAGRSGQSRIKCFLSLLRLFIIDIAPIPVPPRYRFWNYPKHTSGFYQMVGRIYDGI